MCQLMCHETERGPSRSDEVDDDTAVVGRWRSLTGRTEVERSGHPAGASVTLPQECRARRAPLPIRDAER